MLFSLDSLDAKENEVIERVNEMRESLRYNLSQPRRWSGLLRRATFARAIPVRSAVTSTDRSSSIKQRSTGSSSGYGGRLSVSNCPGRNSADGAFSI